jgi:hypothetical protein
MSCVASLPFGLGIQECFWTADLMAIIGGVVVVQFLCDLKEKSLCL